MDARWLTAVASITVSLFLTLFAAMVPAAAQSTGSVSGVVADETGAPLAGVSVTLRRSTIFAGHLTHTSADGRFEVPDLSLGEYTLDAALDGFAQLRRTVWVAAGEPARVSITLALASLVDQVTVTASRTGESDPLTTPIAVTALPKRELNQLSVQSIDHVAGLAPGVTFSQLAGYGQVTIRGIGTNAVFAGSDPSSAVYLDGVYLARPTMLLTDFLNLDRIEVLRGPQGTLFGRNSVGGAIHLISRPPPVSREAFATVTVGNYDKRRFEGGAGGPIVGNRVLGSVALLRGTRHGVVQDLDHADRPLGGEDVTAMRGQVRMLMPPRADLLVQGDFLHQDPIPLVYSKVLAAKPGFRVDNPAALHAVRTSSPARSRNVQGGGSARLTLQLSPSITLASLTALRRLDYDVIADTDITELHILETRIQEQHRQLSEELTLTGRSRRTEWIAGLFLFGEHDEQPSAVRVLSSGVENRFSPRIDADARAAFGQMTVSVGRRLSLVGGARYLTEEKRIETAGALYRLDTETLAGAPGYAYTDLITYDAWTPKLGLNFRAGDDTLMYGSATRGFKSGGFNFTSPEPGRGFAPEYAWSYEAGVKAGRADGQGQFRLAAFYNDYTDLQVQSVLRPGVLDITNAAAATIRGIEVEATARLRRSIDVGGFVTWLDARYDRYVAVGAGGVTRDVAGHRLNNAPQWSTRAWLAHAIEAGRIGTIELRGDSTWQSQVFFTPFNDSVERQPLYGLLYLHAALKPTNGPWSLAFYGRNLANAAYITSTSTSPPPAIGGRPGEPRQFGVSLSVGYRR